jgi:hypothetical protein
MPRSSNPHFRSARIGGRANRPDLPVRAASRVKSSRGSETFSRNLLVDIAGWFELLRERRQDRIQVDEALGLCARAYGAVIRIAGSRSMLPDLLF